MTQLNVASTTTASYQCTDERLCGEKTLNFDCEWAETRSTDHNHNRLMIPCLLHLTNILFDL